MNRLIFIFALLFFCACATQAGKPSENVATETRNEPVTTLSAMTSEPTAVIAKPMRLAWHGKHKDADEWTKHLVKILSVSNLPDEKLNDAQSFCPGYKSMTPDQRIEFWAQLVSIMAKRESGFKPETKFTESFKDAKGKLVISRGLLQLSIESGRSYGCDLSSPESLHDGKKNLACGVKIISRWVSRDHQAMATKGNKFGCGRYWSVCRTTSRSYGVVRDYMRGLAICKG
jgi:hypothetical protein